MQLSQEEITLVHWLLNLCESDDTLFAHVQFMLRLMLGPKHRALKLSTVRNALNTAQEISSDIHLNNDPEKQTLADVAPATELSVEEQVEDIIAKELIIQAIERNFNPRDQMILASRFNLKGEGVKTLRELGKLFNLSPERVRQIEIKALKTLTQDNSLRQLYDD